ncbi:MAG: right-handed parallel beta-helix repeat-containing protein, partial [Bacteroidetes bacterium]|nr:right-handed parallel beta-helix repeat-containing protein [Bacteroidota bacterium]
NAIALLEGFRRGQLPVSQVFALEKMARFFALADLLKMHHATVWKSMRFYYNPLTGKLEPIGYDGHLNLHEPDAPLTIAEAAFSGQGGWYGEFYQPWFQLFFQAEGQNDSLFIKQYVKELVRISEKDYLDQFIQSVQPQLSANLRKIRKDFLLPEDHIQWYGPDLHTFSTDIFYLQQDLIRKTIFPDKARFRGFKGIFQGNKLEILGANLTHLPIELTKISSKNQVIDQPVRKVIFPKPRTNTSVYEPVVISLKNPEKWHDSLWQDIWIHYRIWGTDTSFAEKVKPWRRLDHELMFPPLLAADFTEFPFLVVDSSTQTIHIKPGEWEVNKPLIFPEGDYKVKVYPGTQLNLVNEAFIYSGLPLIWEGKEEQPIRVISTDQTGRGIFVMNSLRTSEWSHVYIQNQKTPNIYGRNLTGAVTFYQSPVKLHAVFIHANHSEDAINLIRSEFEMENCGISQAEFDGVDLDFCHGEIRNLKIIDSGNDGIDFSGSQIEVKGIHVSNSGDKGISIGEESVIKLENVRIENANIGIAVKDLSEAEIMKAELIDCDTALAAYEKKPEYGGGKLKLSEIKFQNIQTKYLIDEGSECILDGKPILSTWKKESPSLLVEPPPSSVRK